ncbi:MAG: S1C family serine protease [Oscillospiraceae bacterium]|nr:S1C family serine protease [Oscillospiraceae bacterium]
MDNNNNNQNSGYTPSYTSQPGVTYTPPSVPVKAPEIRYEVPRPIPEQSYQPPQYSRIDDDDDGNKKQGKSKAIRVLAVMLVLTLLVAGGGLGIGIKYLIDENQAPQIVTQAPTYTPNTQPAANSDAPALIDGSVRLSASNIYAQSVDSCVGISTEISIQSYFGTRTGTISGSGFIISSDGYIVTNNHVIEDAFDQGLDVTISMHDGTEYKAVIVGAEPANDVALLKIEPKEPLRALALGSLDNTRIGEDVFVIGNPLGYLTFTITEGILSAFDREIYTDSTEETAINMFQISAPINSGNSGGPVFNDRGEVIGIASAKTSQASVEGLGFAIPMDDVRDMINDWQSIGYRPRPVLGVKVQTIDGYDRNTGAAVKGAGVIDVTPGGAAEAGGIQLGDVITKIDGHKVTSNNDLISYLRRNYGAGDTAKITVYRNVDNKGQSVELEVTFSGMEPVAPVSPSPTLPDYFN